MSSNIQHQIGGFSSLDYELRNEILKMTWNVKDFKNIYEEVVFMRDTAKHYQIEQPFNMQLITAHVFQFSHLYKTNHIISEEDKKKERKERSKFYNYLLGLLST